MKTCLGSLKSKVSNLKVAAGSTPRGTRHIVKSLTVIVYTHVVAQQSDIDAYEPCACHTHAEEIDDGKLQP